MVEAKGEKWRKRKETRREEAERGGEKIKEKKTKKGEDNRSKKGSRRVGDLKWGRSSSKT